MEQRYYDSEKIVNDKVYIKISREVVKEVLHIAEKRLNKKSAQMVVLDVGCGVGIYSNELAKYVKKVIGVEPFKESFNMARKHKNKKLFFYNCKIEDFVTKDKFDLTLSLSTIEHMPQAERSFERIFELMREGGILYFTGPNKLWPFENHYKLPFLHWLPLSLANLYLKLTKKGNDYEDCSYFRTYFGTRKLFNRLPCKYEFYLPDPNSLYLGCGEKSKIYHMVKGVGISLIRILPVFWVISKGFIIIAKKVGSVEANK